MLLALALAACQRARPEEQPDTAVRELLENLRGPALDQTRTKAIYGLLSNRARANLQARAARYTDASGKTIGPEAMLAPPSALAFEARRFRVLRRDDTTADVEVAGLLPGERAVLRCVKEDGTWRVDLSLPPPPAVVYRPGATQAPGVRR